MATHLIQKAGESTWYVRIIVPADVRHAFGNRRTLTKTTGTSNKAEAMDRRLPILATWKAQIAAVRQQRLERGDAWKERAQKAGSRLAELVEGQTLSAMGLRQSEEMTIEEKRTILQRYFTVMSTAVEEGGLSQETFTSALTDLIKSAEERMHNPATPSREERLDEVLRSKQASKQAAMEIISMSNKLSPAEVVELESMRVSEILCSGIT
ncbi:DUF6538 domain-containing protein [Pseudomonas sp.]|uniref:DUF6538 domain-containing protein n=1 Tax=Pseudomonas sp. TaxID=306 RepID=UPI00289EFBDE|nr:DUF6538 domain-containing protein [Pseudomonas sp.]